jgi:hypothetical protein
MGKNGDWMDTDTKWKRSPWKGVLRVMRTSELRRVITPEELLQVLSNLELSQQAEPQTLCVPSSQ